MVCDLDQYTGVGDLSMSVRLFGQITVVVGGREVSISARRQRAVLACLALHPGEAVSADRLLDEVWGDDLPDTRSRAVAFQISKLRDILEPERVGEGLVITTSTAGYVLHVERDSVDVHRFDRLLDDARAALASDPPRCQVLIDEASALWRGRPFADLGDEPFVAAELRRLDQRYMVAQRTRIEVALALGRHVDVVGDLESMVAEHSTEESVVQMLMVALQRSGRTADALRVFGEFRMRLSHELGIDPSRDLQAFEAQLLAGGPDIVHGARPGHRRPHGVPAAATSLVGRTIELAGIADLLSAARLVTLCGFGGLGKTRLAQEIGRSEADRFADGVWFVDLTSIDDAGLLVNTFLAAGGVVADGRDPVDRLVGHLVDREVLVVIDNCEHLIDDVAGLVASVVRSAPGVRILATSRLGLGVAGEAIWTVHPLEPASAVQLFVDRARLVRPGLVVDETNRADLERLGAHLDGIPLAIEMAAARLSVMTIAQICGHLDDRFALLTRTGRNLDDKQRSLAEVMDWSYRLLGDAAQTLLRRLAVCAGGFTLEAAMAIGVPTGDNATAAAVLDHLGQLVEASLVVFDDRDDAPRYRMLDTVRQYASDRLERDPHEDTEAALAHADHYTLVASEVSDMQDEDYDGLIRLGDREIGNLHAALGWAYGNGHPRLGLTISRQLWSYYVVKRMFEPAMRNLRTGLAMIDDPTPEVLEAAALALIAVNNSDDHDRAFSERAEAMIERGMDEIADPALRSTLLRGLASWVGHADARRADAYLREAAELQPVPARSTFAALQNRIGASWWSGRLDDGDAVLQHVEKFIAAFPAHAPSAVYLRATVAARDGRWNDVVRIAETSEQRPEYEEFRVRIALVEALVALGRHDDAEMLLRQIEAVVSTEHVHYVPYLWAALELAQGSPVAAVAALEQRVEDIRRDSRRLLIAVQLTSLLAVAAHDLGQDETAAVLFGYSVAEQRRLDVVLRASDRPRAERAIGECRTTLGEERFDELATRGARAEFADLPAVDTGSTAASPKNAEARSD